MEKCFADAGNKCRALIEKYCNTVVSATTINRSCRPTCPFYKTLRQYDEDRAKAERLYQKHIVQENIEEVR